MRRRTLHIASLLLVLPRLVGATCSATDPYSTVICSDTPAVYFRFNDVSVSPNGTESDLSGNGCDSTYTAIGTNLTGSQTGIVGAQPDLAVLNTTGTDYLQRTGTTCDSAYTSNGGVTVEAWIKKAVNTNFQYIFGVGGGSNWQYGIASGGVFDLVRWDCGASNSSNAPLGSTAVVIGTYFHVVAVINGATSSSLYVNGALEGTTSSYGYTPCTSTTGFNKYIWARGDGGNILDATLDEAAVYRGVLSGARIAAHYAAGTTVLGGTGGGFNSFSVKAPVLPPFPRPDLLRRFISDKAYQTGGFRAANANVRGVQTPIAFGPQFPLRSYLGR